VFTVSDQLDLLSHTHTSAHAAHADDDGDDDGKCRVMSYFQIKSASNVSV